MLRKIRITVAVILFAAITLLFLDISGALHHWLGWLAKIQFLPAVMALNAVVIIALLLLTILFGRVYCSTICPLGVFQDGISWLSARRKGKKARFTYSKEMKWLRYGIFVIFVIALIAGIHFIVSLLAPYSSYGRFVQNLFSPVYHWGNNLLAYLAERRDSYAFVTKEVCLLRHGGVDKEPADIHHRRRHVRDSDCPCLERRQDILQRHLPCGDHA